MALSFPDGYRSKYQYLAAATVNRLRHSRYFPLLALFDRPWYLSQNADVAARSRGGAFAHYVRYGAKEGREPSPFFSTPYYRRQAGNLVRADQNAAEHYLKIGWRRKLNPHPLFDTDWYLKTNPDVETAGINPLLHWVMCGISEGRMPTPLVDSSWYLTRYPDVANAKVNAAEHYIRNGAKELRDPHPLFDTQWYLETYPDVRMSGQNALAHFVEFGAAEGRDPSPRFSTRGYLAQDSSLRADETNALLHYLTSGPNNGIKLIPSENGYNASQRYFAAGEITAGAVSGLREAQIPSVEANFLFRPLNVEVDPVLSAEPRVLVLLPGLNRRYATGGPNTAYILGALLAQAGIPLSFVSVDVPPDSDITPLKQHIKQLTGVDPDQHGVQFVDASNRERPFKLGYNDVLFATAWWTAQPAKAAAAMLRSRRIYYLIQDFESTFYGGSVTHAVARETYSFDHLPVINTTLLRDQLAEEKVGKYTDRTFVDAAIVFEPAVDRSYFYPQRRPQSEPRRLLFYARPTMAERNLFGLGVAALRAAAANGIFDEGAWEFVAMGEDIAQVPLGGRHVLKPAPWLDFSKYAELMRTSDLLISLMFSPHPSYPPLEMAACGKPVITTCFGVKTRERLAELSPFIMGVEPTVDAVAHGISRALLRRDRPRVELGDHLKALPTSWTTSLSRIMPQLLGELLNDGISPRSSPPAARAERQSSRRSLPVTIEMDTQRRKTLFRETGEKDLLAYVSLDLGRASCEAFKRSLLAQDSRHVPEWIVSETNCGTLADEKTVGAYRFVDATSSIQAALESSSKRYLAWLVPNYELLPDASRVIEAALEQFGLPKILIVTGGAYQETGQAHRFPAPLFVFDRLALLHCGVDLKMRDPALNARRMVGDLESVAKLNERLVLVRTTVL
ncbi:hypothetical protein [Mesorhizobium sp.]|uniref:rhamnosyltransferase WsaF family glycosyltransferase n=1 Tax=Mesorhizobium sp. TaxID=1871066 RepID=UPI001218015B|nr:hypothetical protein [Mesorhizobium sp.]TIO77088.1 MAG: glycosyltransferase family 4 protein [Mesorhizobium sp.]